MGWWALMVLLVLNSAYSAEPDESKQFPLFYRMRGGNGLNSFECSAEDTIVTLKMRLAEIINCGEFDFSISIAGTEITELIDEEQTLADASICAESIIEIDVKSVLANGYYQFVSAHSGEALDAMPAILDPMGIAAVKVRSEEIDPERYCGQLFFVQRESCGYYKVQALCTDYFWQSRRYYRDYFNNGHELHQTHESAQRDLFAFDHDVDGKWFIKTKRAIEDHRNEVLTIGIAGNTILEFAKSNANSHYRAQQLFYCKRVPLPTLKEARNVLFVYKKEKCLMTCSFIFL